MLNWIVFGEISDEVVTIGLVLLKYCDMTMTNVETEVTARRRVRVPPSVVWKAPVGVGKVRLNFEPMKSRFWRVEVEVAGEGVFVVRRRPGVPLECLFGIFWWFVCLAVLGWFGCLVGVLGCFLVFLGVLGCLIDLFCAFLCFFGLCPFDGFLWVFGLFCLLVYIKGSVCGFYTSIYSILPIKSPYF